MKTLKTLIREKIGTMLAGVIPTKPRAAVVDSRQEPPSMALNMDAGRVMAVIAAAEGGYTRDLFALYRDVIIADSHLQGEWTKRKLSVLGDSLTILPFNKEDPKDVATAAAVKQAIAECKTWRSATSSLLDATLYPVSVIEKTFRPTGSGYAIEKLTPVPYHLLDYSTGRMRIFDVDQQSGAVLSTTHDPDPNRYIVHRGHLLSSPDNWGGPMRSLLFWWLLSAMDREWWARFLERYGSPFLVGKFADEEGQNVLTSAFSLATRLGGLVISSDTSVEIQKASASDSGDAYDKFLTICQREKSKLILGQTLSSEAQPGGLGGGAADLQSDVREDIRRFDATVLADTMLHQLIAQFCVINNLPGKTPKLIWGSQSQNDTKNTTALLQSLAAANLELTDDGITSIGDSLGVALQRRSPSQSPVGFSAIRRGLADGSQLGCGRRADASKIVMTSRSKQEAIARLSPLFPELSEVQIVTLMAEILPG